uniref:hypothetical protein n=1 Tax=Amycolatopsis sp. CA-082387 TaxID=3239918 RepID=UPI003F494048
MAGLIGLLEKIVTSTPNCVRAVASIVLLAVVAIGGLWLLNADLKVGPVDITGREHPVADQLPACTPQNPTDRTVRCAG